jgi:hypothetical protein
MYRLVYTILLCLLSTSFVSAQHLPRQQISSSSSNRLPVTDKAVNNDTTAFQFAIMSDRTGGMLPGVFEKAVGKVNLLQPEFVLSVGDLIDGYTESAAVWDAQWDEFMGIVDRLEMPFFFVPGNHDISNKLLLEVWKQRLGSPYYHFSYKGVLFIALHTEDGPRNNAGISTEQAEYVQKVLSDHADARWTMLFMHRPLWSYEDKLGYERIDSALGSRPFTVFSGHHHHYLYREHNGRDHYVLATTGGGSHLRGVEFGEFEHVTWVTMKEDGPVVAHLEIDHIHDKNVVTESSYSLVQTLRNGEWLKVYPVFGEVEMADHLTAQLQIDNTETDTMTVFGQLEPWEGVRFEPSFVRFKVPPKQTSKIDLQLIAEPSVSLHAINESGLAVQLTALFKTDTRELQLPTRRNLLFDWNHRLTKGRLPIQIDGDLDDWHDIHFTRVRNPMFMHEDWDWRGPDDGNFEFAVTMDDSLLYVAIKAWDDVMIQSEKTGFKPHQDQFYIQLDGSSEGSSDTVLPERLYGSQMIDPKYHLQIRIAPGTEAAHTLLEINDPATTVTGTSRLQRQEGLWLTELYIPLSYLIRLQGDDWSSFRLNIGWMDHDRPENTKPSILWWRPVWGSESDHPSFGRWFRE